MTKGRSRELLKERDQKIFERYYYWTEEKRRRFDDVLNILSTEEFFLSEARILKILRMKIDEGATCNGKGLTRPMFGGFRNMLKNRAG